MSVNSRPKATTIIGQRKAFYRQNIPKSSWASKETADIDILVTSRNGDRKIMQSTRITSRPSSTKTTWNQSSKFWRTSEEQNNTYRKELSWPQFDDEPRAKEKQQVKEQQLYISIFVACLRFQIATRHTSPDVTTVFHTWAYGSFIEIQSNIRKKLHRTD